VFNEGKIVERGDHNTLSFAWGAYQKMLELQSGFMC
jgi:ABC-type transport system involved in Fe-S cluster assembly fused permease/ATPase subunit